MSHLITASEFEDALKESKFEEGKPADPTKNMSPEDAAEWERQNEENKDNFKSAAKDEVTHKIVTTYKDSLGREKTSEDSWLSKWGKPTRANFEKIVSKGVSDPAGGFRYAVVEAKLVSRGETVFTYKPKADKSASFLLSAEEVEESLKESKFEEGKPADPTKHMSPEDAAEWERQNEENKDNFKSAEAKTAKFPRGESMTIDEVAAVVGDEFREMNENPPESVLKVREEMGKSASEQDDWAEATKLASTEMDKTAAGSGLYGFTKDAEKACGAAANRLAKFAAKLAKDIYTKDGDTPEFLEVHNKRTGCKTSRMLRAAMSDIGPGAPSKTAGKSSKGRYGYSAKTARLALDAITQVQHEAGVIAGDLNDRRAKKHGEITGFFGKHSSKAKCGWSELILDAYPDAMVEEAPVASKTAAGVDGYTIHPSVDELLSWDGSGRTRSAASFLASEEEDLDEDDLDE